MGCKAYLYWTVKDWKLARRLVPKYKYGYRAVHFSNKFHAAFNLPNVTLNDSIVTKVEDNTITTEDGQSKDIDVSTSTDKQKPSRTSKLCPTHRF